MEPTTAYPESAETVDAAIQDLVGSLRRTQEAFEGSDDAMQKKTVGKAVDIFMIETDRCLASPLHWKQVFTEMTGRVIALVGRAGTDPADFAVDLSDLDSEMEARAYTIIQYWVRAHGSGDSSRISEVTVLSFISLTNTPELMAFTLRAFSDLLVGMEAYLDSIADED